MKEEEKQNIIFYNEKEQRFGGIIESKPFIIYDKGFLLKYVDEESEKFMTISQFRDFLKKFDVFLLNKGGKNEKDNIY